MKVYNDYVVLIRSEPKQITKGGIVLPVNATKTSFDFTVIAIGSKCQLDIKEGDRVFIDVRNAIVTILDDKEYVVIKSEHIMGQI